MLIVNGHGVVALTIQCFNASINLVAFDNQQTQKHFCTSNQIKSFIILAVLRLSVSRACGAYLRIITPAGATLFPI